jgi:photosynthetic reaction center H subunit
MSSDTAYIDLAQIVLYLFWIFFAGVMYHLLRENKREGYPLESSRGGNVVVQGWPSIPPAKTYKLTHGGTFSAPDGVGDPRPVQAQPVSGGRGAALHPTGDPMTAGVGPGAFANRANVPERTITGANKIVPLRVAKDFHLDKRDPDPRGMHVLGADGVSGGKVIDAWVDRAEVLIRYLEVDTGKRRVMLPMTFARVKGGHVHVQAVMGKHFANVPATQAPDQITLLEEDRICGYFGAGTLYAEPSRLEPLL